MGVHLVLPSRLNAGVLNAEQPEALIYEPMTNGAMRLVGVEFIVLASVWESTPSRRRRAGAGRESAELHCCPKSLRSAVVL